MHRRSLRLGLLTVLGLARRGFFIPYRYADTFPEPGHVPRYLHIEEMFASAQSDFADVLSVIDGMAADLNAIDGSAPPEPRWTQDWFPTLDAAAAYAVVRQRRPGHIVEVGSGHSTRFLYRAVRDGGLETVITAIDPQPSRGVDRLDIDFRRTTLGKVDPTVFAALNAGDILFIDSSHILMPGSDVDDLLNRIMPMLPSGVLVHVHDIFLPDDYPAAWGWRGYNEQQAVASLISSGAYRPFFASHYVATRMAGQVSASAVGTLPSGPGGYPASLWLEKR
jgi:predicted O-methyltransferase YrrM